MLLEHMLTAKKRKPDMKSPWLTKTVNRMKIAASKPQNICNRAYIVCDASLIYFVGDYSPCSFRPVPKGRPNYRKKLN